MYPLSSKPTTFSTQGKTFIQTLSQVVGLVLQLYFSGYEFVLYVYTPCNRLSMINYSILSHVVDSSIVFMSFILLVLISDPLRF